MPLPFAVVPLGVRLLIQMVPRIITFFRNRSFLELYAIGDIAERIYSGEMKDEINAEIASEAARLAGLNLDPAAPLSDASFAAALTEKTGVAIRTLKDRDSIVEDFEQHAIGIIQEKTGFRVSGLRDPEQIKHDLVNIGLSVVQQKTGIPISPLTGKPGDWGPQLKDQLLTWAEAQLRQRLASDASTIAAKMGELVDLDALAGHINKRLADIGSTQDIDVRGLALGIAEQVAAGAVQKFQVQANQLNKGTRRAAQNREAQRRFRAKWGDRRQYMPVTGSAPPDEGG